MTTPKKITRREFIQALALGIVAVTGSAVLGEPVTPQKPTSNLYKTCIDICVQAMNLGIAATALERGEGSADEARAELARLKAMIEAIVI